MKPTPQQLIEITKGFVDRGLIIEAGWTGFRYAVYPQGAPPEQIAETRAAFFAGSAHLFASIMNMLDPGEDETPADLRRMDAIRAELERFEHEFKRKHGLT